MCTDMSGSYRWTVLGLGFCILCVFTVASLFVLGLVFVFCVFSVCHCLVVSTSAVNCLERLVSEMNPYVLNATLNPTRSLTVHTSGLQGSGRMLTSRGRVLWRGIGIDHSHQRDIII